MRWIAVGLLALLVAIVVMRTGAGEFDAPAFEANPDLTNRPSPSEDSGATQSSAISDREAVAPQSTRPAARARDASSGLEVKVIDQRSALPLAAAVVMILPFRAELLHPDVEWSRVTTGADGQARIDLAPGSFWLRGVSGRLGSLARTVRVPAGEHATVVLELGPELRLNGHVIDPDGEFAGGAILHVDAHGVRGTYRRVFGTTDSAGRFLIELPDADVVGLSISVDVPKVARNFFEFSLETLLASQELELRLSETRVVGRCVDTEGRTVARASIEMEHSTLDAECGEDGRFELVFGGGGSHDLLISSERHAPRLVRIARSGPGNVIDVGDVELSAGRPVHGVVTSDSGKAVAGASLVLSNERFGRVVRVAASGADGTFRFQHVGEGPHTLAVKRRPLSWPLFLLPIQRTGLLAGGAPVAITLPRPIRVHVRFRDTAGAVRACEGFSFEVRRTGDSQVLHTVPPVSHKGESFAFEVHEPGRYDVLVRVEGFAPVELEAIRVGRAGEHVFDAVLTPR